MISSTNNKSNQSETFAPLYEVLLYKKKDIIAIQEKLGINSNTLKQLEHEPDGKTLADSYKLLLHLVEDLIPIQENLEIDGNPILAVEYNNVWQIKTIEVLPVYHFRNYLICFYTWKRI